MWEVADYGRGRNKLHAMTGVAFLMPLGVVRRHRTGS